MEEQEYAGEDRRMALQLTEEEINAIAEKAADRLEERIYQQIGRSVTSKFLWFVGFTAVAAYAWIINKSPAEALKAIAGSITEHH